MGVVDGGLERTSDGGHLARRLGLASATALVVGEVIGVGIFLTPAGMARSLGSPAWLLGVWLAMGVVTLAGALCFGGFAARHPEAGGSYVYLREAFGPRVAFLFGWMAMLVTDPGLTALFAVGLADTLAPLLGLSAVAVKGLAVGAIVGLGLVNVVGVSLGAGLLRGLVVVKLGLLLLLAVWGVGAGRGAWSNLSPFVGPRPGVGAFLGAFVSAFFSFAGWWDASKIAGEVREPGRTVPRALALGVGVVTAVYLLVSLVFVYLVPTATITSDRAFAALAGEALFGRSGGRVFAGIVATAVLGSLACILMAAPRVYYAMARDGLFFRGVAAVHPRFQTPARAVLIQTVLASALVASGTFDQILAYFFFVTVAFLALTVAGAYRPGMRPGPAGVGRVPGYPVTPLVFLLPIVLLLVLLAADKPRESLLGSAVVLLGLPFYRLVAPRSPRPSGDPAIG